MNKTVMSADEFLIESEAVYSESEKAAFYYNEEVQRWYNEVDEDGGF